MLSKKALLVSDYENYKFCLVVSNGVKQRKNRAHYDNVLYFNTFFCELQIQFKAKDFTPRTPETYDYHCSLLNGPLSRENATTYGITYMSPLNQLHNYHVVNQLPQDIMHVLLEGMVPFEVSLMLYCFVIEKCYFSIDKLNGRITNYLYTTRESRNKPSPIRPQIFTSQGNRISQSGMLCNG